MDIKSNQQAGERTHIAPWDNHETTAVICYNENGVWELEIKTGKELRFAAYCSSMKEAVEALNDWTNGVIIV